MSDLRISDSDDLLRQLMHDVAELKRRARVPDNEQHESTCCTSYCAEAVVQEDLSTGENFTLATIDPDPVGGEAMRLNVRAMVELRAMATGPVFAQLTCSVDATIFVGKPRWADATATDGDLHSITWEWQIDVATADPTIVVKVQNQGVTALRAVQYHVAVDISSGDGSISCGSAAGTNP